jgi:lipid-binding SYLF domain-containing protein
MPNSKKETTMKTSTVIGIIFAVLLLASYQPFQVTAADKSPEATQIDRDVDGALKKLYDTTPAAEGFRKEAKGILVFPSIVKGGFIVGGYYGKGALRKNGETAGYYDTAAASYGLQAGVQTFGYVLFFMNDEALAYLDKSNGWEVGVGPSIVVMDKGAGKSLGTTTGRSDVYAFIFSQQGLMAGLGLQGSKISRITP